MSTLRHPSEDSVGTPPRRADAATSLRSNAPAPRTPPAALSRDAINPLSPRFGMLVTEIAAQIDPLADILVRHGLTKRDWARLQTLPAFRAALDEQNKAFSSIANLPARIKLKAQLLTEALLDEMFELACNIAQPGSARVSAFAQIKNLTGLEKPEDALPQRQFNLTINLGDGKVKTAQAVTLEAIRERDAIAGDSRFTFAEDGGEHGAAVDDLLDGAVVYDSDIDPDHSGELVGEPEAAEQSARPKFDRTWSSFSNTTKGPTLSRAAPPSDYEPSRPFAGAVGGRLPGVDETDVGQAPERRNVGTTPLRSAIERAKSSSNSGD